MMGFASMSLSGIGNRGREFVYEIDTKATLGPTLRIMSERPADDEWERDVQYELAVDCVSAAQADTLANAFAQFASAIHEHEAECARRRGEQVIEREPALAATGGE